MTVFRLGLRHDVVVLTGDRSTTTPSALNFSRRSPGSFAATNKTGHYM